jgi:hypothetical protein
MKKAKRKAGRQREGSVNIPEMVPEMTMRGEESLARVLRLGRPERE